MPICPLSLKFREFSSNHPIWQNVLLRKSAAGELSFSDYQMLFSQYYFYSKSFLRILATMMVKCGSIGHNIQLVDNLWEETGKSDQTQSHSMLFRIFLTKALGISSVELIKQRDYTENFVNDYINLCLGSTAAECAAILAFATEGIVSRLYKMLKQGLLKTGIKEEDLVFFTIHISCDDAHAAVLEAISVYYSYVDNWENISIQAINKALCLRDTFLKNIYNDIKIKSMV